ncbi:hypothetical protein [Hyalangium gracile]|uniref:hypothetical protein n=1 Tax=Hyalangium gracile TaxID=394092 RepID=UPI001CCA786F|nr:hypothetical protein [Hyalangium gracile]
MLAHGFARVRCESCKDELLAAQQRARGQGLGRGQVGAVSFVPFFGYTRVKTAERSAILVWDGREIPRRKVRCGMPLFDNGAFDGDLAELIQRCMQFVPAPERLAEADQWLASLEEDGRLLPVRKFAGRPTRGELFAVGRRRFVPIDNETLVHLYRELLEGGVPEGDFEDLYRRGALTVSWKLDTETSALGSQIRKGQVAAPFRDEGLKLAHLIDAARGLAGETEPDLVQRFRLTLNPLNCIPFPSPKRYRFEPMRGYFDPGEAPHIQALLAAALAEYAGAPFLAYRARVGGNREPLPSRWRELARDIRVRFTLRQSQQARPIFAKASAQTGRLERDSWGVIDSDVDAITPRGSPLRFANMAALMDALREWRHECPNAERLHGHRTFLKMNRRTGRQTISSSDPKAYVYFHITPKCVLGACDHVLREWHLNGDTSVSAIDELIGLYEAQDQFDAIFMFEAVKTQDKLMLQGNERSNGLYCYG